MKSCTAWRKKMRHKQLNIKKYQGLFITGTDTDVGKTMVTAALLAALRQTSINAVVMKPVQTGCATNKGRLSAPDLDFCCRKAALEIPLKDEQLVCPYRFAPACSPHLAANLANQKISVEKIKRAYKKLSEVHDFVLVEGAGGILVPINNKLFMLDLIKILDLPTIIVARAELGTINHSLLTIRELQKNNIEILGVVFNEAQPSKSKIIKQDNLKTIEYFGNVPILANLPYTKNFKTLITKFKQVIK